MTKPIPPEIKRNFIYRRAWNLINRKEMNVIFLFIGDVGKGKSTAALRVAEDLDPGFSVERVCFSLDEFFTLIKDGDSNGKLKRGSAIVFDEPAGSKEGIDSRDSLTHTNKIVSWFTTISRAKGYIICYCSPMLSQLDKRVRSIGVTGIFHLKGVDFNAKRGRASFYWRWTSGFSGVSLNPKPRLHGNGERLQIVSNLTIPPPDKFMLKIYKKKKDEFINKSIAQWKKELDGIKAKGKVNLAALFERAKGMEDELRDSKGKISKGLVQIKLEVGDGLARSVTALLVDELGN